MGTKQRTVREILDDGMRQLEVPSLNQLARRLNIARETVSRHYNGRGLPDEVTARKYAAAFGLSPDEIPQDERRGVHGLLRRLEAVEAEVAKRGVTQDGIAASLVELEQRLESLEREQDGRRRRQRS